MFAKCYKLSAVQLVEIINNINDLSARYESTMVPITFPLKCKESDDTKTYLETNYPGAIAMANAKHWSINYQ